MLEIWCWAAYSEPLLAASAAAALINGAEHCDTSAGIDTHFGGNEMDYLKEAIAIALGIGVGTLFVMPLIGRIERRKRMRRNS